MALSNTRRIVIIKDIHSNLIEEAILILKSDTTIVSKVKETPSLIKGNKKDNDYLLNEAQSVIDNYVKENKFKVASGIDLNLKEVKIPRTRLITNMTINLVLAGGIALLIFLVLKVF
ncbi:MAG: hypothetical protein Q8942_17165 [Bacillota bacterium]|nr:hypothetical protein [Bacillota bacterium]